MYKIIKFRGKIKDEQRAKELNLKVGDWVYGYYFHDTGVIVHKKEIKEFDKHYIINTPYIGEFIEVIPETIGQFTGLKDKNGKEIYEGDILELNKDGRIFYGTNDGLLAKKYQLVGFKDGAFMTCRNKHLIDDYDTYLWIISKYSTVAGNIYDNKNLLEEGE